MILAPRALISQFVTENIANLMTKKRIKNRIIGCTNRNCLKIDFNFENNNFDLKGTR